MARCRRKRAKRIFVKKYKLPVCFECHVVIRNMAIFSFHGEALVILESSCISNESSEA